MTDAVDPADGGRPARIAALIETLHQIEQQLETLTAGEVDTVANRAGRTVLLRRAQEQLRQQDADRQTALLNALPAHIAVLDAAGRIVAVNDAWRRFGNENGLRELDHGVGRNYLDVCAPAPGSGAAETWAVASGLRAVLSGERSGFSIEYACNSALEDRRFLLTVSPLAAPGPSGAMVMHVNVSARARAEQASLRSSELLQAVADGTPDVVYIKDTAGCYLLCNQALADFTGRPIDQILGSDDATLYGAAEAGSLIDNDRTLFAAGQVQATEKWLTGVHGRRLFHSRRAPYRDARGAVIGVIGIARDITDDRQSQQALRDSTAMLDMAGRSAKVGGWTFDTINRVLDWSDLVAALHDEPPGYSPTMDVGLAAFVPEHREAVRQAVERCIATGEPYDMEAEKISATGRRFWVRTIGEAARNAEGRIVRIQGAMQDITERKRAALATQKLATRLSNTLESITDAFFTVDHDWHFTYINREAERLWGRQRDTLLRRGLWDVYPEALGTAFDHCYRRAMAGEAGVSFEAFYPPLQRWFGVDCHPSDDGLSVYFRDITAMRVSRQHLRLLEASVAQLNDMVIITEPAPGLAQGLRIVFVNDAFVQMTGYARDEVLGRSPALLNGPGTDPADVERIRLAVERFEPVHAELLEHTRSGRAHWVELDITPVAATGEQCTHFVTIGRDISERRRSEEALRELNAGLEDRVRQRTRELESARELAEQANRAKSSFLAMMSHEIRTPMNGVVGMIDVLEQSQLLPNQRDMVKTVRESAYALLAIVDDVLDFSKIEAGQFEIEHEPMDPAAVVEGVCDALRRLSESQGVLLRLYVDPRLPACMPGDAGRLRQVLMNLVGNAIKFSRSPQHLGAVSVRALRVCDAVRGDSLALVVSDNGIGMDAGSLARLFSPFTQADASTTRRFGGTGLGLSISQRLVALMGGEITVSSQAEQGATFTVHLPMPVPLPGEAACDPVAAGPLAGLPCLLLGTGGPVADLADYLAHAGCPSPCVAALSDALAWLRRVEPGRCVLVVADPMEGTDPVLAACRAAAQARPGLLLAFVVIEVGRRLRPRRQQVDQVGLDGACLHRSAFLGGVALAARLGPEPDENDARAGDDIVPVRLDPGPGTVADPLILVAEDNEINQKVLAKQLALLGYRAEMVGNGVQALARWRLGGHALLLTDLHMPEMDGYTLAAAVRAEQGAGPRRPIIALTANALRDEAQRCHQAGMDGYLSKPVRLAQLKAAIDVWLRPPPADLSVLAELVDDDAQVMQEVLAAFRSNTAQSALELSRAHADGAFQDVADIAHKLKSAARAIGASRLGQICADIEASAGSTPRGEALGLLTAAFDAELRAVHHFLDQR